MLTLRYDTLPEDVKNPDVEPSRFTGVWPLILVMMVELQRQLDLWANAPWWASVLVAALPVLIRWVREKIQGVPMLFRRKPE
jgi:hypothetical protein